MIFKIKRVGIKTLYLMHDKKEIDEYELSGNSLVGIFVAISIALSKKLVDANSNGITGESQ